MAENNATYAPQVDEGQVEAASGQKKSSGACKFLPLLMGRKYIVSVSFNY